MYRLPRPRWALRAHRTRRSNGRKIPGLTACAPAGPSRSGCRCCSPIRGALDTRRSRARLRP
eukprot:7416577-Alexandrium_andersonii.AAC.1